MKKYLKQGVFFSSAFIFMFSLYFFNAVKSDTSKVKSFTDENFVPKPQDASVVSNDTANTENSTVYVTKLSKDQIDSFYKKYGELDDWKVVNNSTFIKGNKKITIKVEQEADNKSLVTYREVRN